MSVLETLLFDEDVDNAFFISFAKPKTLELIKDIIQSLENKYIMQQAENSYKSLNKQYKLSRVIYSLIVIILIMNIIYAIRTYKNKLHCKQRDFESYVVQHETQYGNLQTQYNTLLKQIENYTIMNKEHRIRIAETLKNRMDSLRILSEFAYKYGWCAKYW